MVDDETNNNVLHRKNRCLLSTDLEQGTHADGKEIAVKVLRNINLLLDDKTFSNEFQTLAKLKHQNIIQLLGYCKEAEERLVEYEGRQVIADELHVAICLEYADKGSLHKYISSGVLVFMLPL